MTVFASRLSTSRLIMSRSSHLLFAGAFCALLVGCASSPSISTPVLSTSGSTLSHSTVPTLASKTTKAKHPTVGSSIAGRNNYFNPDGSLSPYIQQWADSFAALNHIPIASVESWLQTAQYNAEAARLMAPSKGKIKRSWSTYKNRFIEPIRIKAGLEFWQQHQHAIEKIADKYGVPPEIIVSIIGVETIYGRYTGNFRVLDALLTLGFSYPDNNRPERGQLFRDQLADLLVLHHQGKINALTVEGSFAGAIGLPQFMPGSLMRYAVDGDNDGIIDLYTSIPDVVASVANFLVEHGWIKNQPIFAPVQLNTTHAAKLVDGGLEPTLKWAQLNKADAITSINSTGSWQQLPLGVINLVEESRGTAEYRLATPNFFALTSYNRSYFYATTVADFAEVLRKQMR